MEGTAVVDVPASQPAQTNQPAYIRIRDLLRQEILSGRIPPGSRLKVADLARRYGVSQMPVRDSLQLLQGEGLVVGTPHQGVEVRPVDERFIRNMYDLRIVLIGYLVERSVARLSDAHIAQLEEVEARFEEAVQSGNIESVLLFNGRLHRLIYEQGDNEEALAAYDRASALIDALRRSYGFSAARMVEMVRDHRRLIEAIKRRDGRDATIIAMDLCQKAKEDLLSQLK